MTSSFLAAKDKAAATMSRISEQYGIKHAYIGGHAMTTLGHDVDNRAPALRNMVQLLIQEDSKFSVENNKLVFTYETHRVPIETLPVGELGLRAASRRYKPGKVGYLPYLVITPVGRY
jgi:hypothetical protein